VVVSIADLHNGTGQTMTKFSAFLGVLFLVGIIGAVAAGCGGATAPTVGPGSTTAAAGPTITISGMAFGEPLTVTPGATITIVNKDSVEHSVTSQPKGPFDTDVDGGAQKTFTAPTQPGEYPFICTYHPSMKGTLIVK
jgi:plastocyanin